MSGRRVVTVETALEDTRWTDIGFPGLAERAVGAALASLWLKPVQM